jgi:hypothetical protein
MKGALDKRRNSVLFLIAFARREGVAGRTQARWGWEAEDAMHDRRLERGKGGTPFPKSDRNSCTKIFVDTYENLRIHS